ncbi:MarR family winged helix-turn-helix transcriptional regulator [Ruminiclostridium josui]|uniref:MarR family winged helix-turn-helix transcriptional regulator n=1 Tax=Ruminiclostridium josui TaxID=1499 RepID=UPI0004663F55|nr:MarR family transcriptional regulator [Ruminiclostridium josui]
MNITDDSKKLRELIRVLERKLGVIKENQTSCCSITLGQCHALVEIGRSGSISLNELADLLNLDNSTMSRTVNNLVKAKLAKRDVDPEDRRYITISLTDSGAKLFTDIEESMNSYFGKIYNSLPKNKKLQVLESLGLLLEAIDKNN